MLNWRNLLKNFVLGSTLFCVADTFARNLKYPILFLQSRARSRLAGRKVTPSHGINVRWVVRENPPQHHRLLQAFFTDFGPDGTSQTFGKTPTAWACRVPVKCLDVDVVEGVCVDVVGVDVDVDVARCRCIRVSTCLWGCPCVRLHVSVDVPMCACMRENVADDKAVNEIRLGYCVHYDVSLFCSLLHFSSPLPLADISKSQPRAHFLATWNLIYPAREQKRTFG